mmetsp:Transcript_30097/g.60368  ORF Transcript_30097/g.60368 Transcript_30097/m.60368 type:complete len:202 (+) Transcript_30097:1090-1695(+)
MLGWRCWRRPPTQVMPRCSMRLSSSRQLCHAQRPPQRQGRGRRGALKRRGGQSARGGGRRNLSILRDSTLPTPPPSLPPIPSVGCPSESAPPTDSARRISELASREVHRDPPQAPRASMQRPPPTSKSRAMRRRPGSRQNRRRWHAQRRRRRRQPARPPRNERARARARVSENGGRWEQGGGRRRDGRRESRWTYITRDAT